MQFATLGLHTYIEGWEPLTYVMRINRKVVVMWTIYYYSCIKLPVSGYRLWSRCQYIFSLSIRQHDRWKRLGKNGN